ncbi:hypothetical protein PENSPDRAFT_670068 [Peniophora sp. CONT]|nr:hypothetical protein PENSPDRAFT_670068 [Peniophora sp. CONT]
MLDRTVIRGGGGGRRVGYYESRKPSLSRLSLPMELWDIIFMLVVVQCPPILGSAAERDWGWRALLCVCRSWRSFILDQKRLWAVAHVHDPSCLPASIARAGDGLLDYSLTLSAPRSRMWLDERVEAVACYHFDARRYRSIHIDRNDTAFYHLHKMLSLPGSLDDLEELFLTATTVWTSLLLLYDGLTPVFSLIRPTDDRVLSAPNMRTATMQGVCVAIQSDALRELEIDFASVDYYARPSMHTIWNALERVCHSLEHLRLEFAVGNYLLEVEPITFAVLKTLHIAGTCGEVHSVLRRLSIPSSTVRDLRVVGMFGRLLGIGQVLTTTLAGTEWTRLKLRTAHAWEDDVVLRVEALESDDPAVTSNDSFIARIDLMGRHEAVPPWHRIAGRVLDVLGRDGLEVHLQIPDVYIVRNASGVLALRDACWESMGGSSLDRLRMTVEPSCSQCGAASGISGALCPSLALRMV